MTKEEITQKYPAMAGVFIDKLCRLMLPFYDVAKSFSGLMDMHLESAQIQAQEQQKAHAAAAKPTLVEPSPAA